MTGHISKTPPVSATSETQCQIPDDLMKLADTLIDDIFLAADYAGQRKAAVAILLRVQTETARRCAEIAATKGKHHLDFAKMGMPIEPSEIIAKDRAKVADNIAQAILEAFPETNRE